MGDLPYANKELGQHWLTDEIILEAICDASDVKGSDTVLEVGPGLGTLTKPLATRAKKVIAVEFDANLAKELIAADIAPNIDVVNQDILKFNLTELPEGYKVVANIPYYLTSKLVRVLSESSNPAQTLVLLVQKEVAERIAAKPGDMSLLTVTSQFYWDVQLDIEVPRSKFTPPPKVDSQVVVMHRKQTPKNIDEKQLFQLVKAGFSSRRKTLLNSLSGGLRISKDETKKLLESSGIDPSRRPQTLSVDEWLSLYKNFTR